MCARLKKVDHKGTSEYVRAYDAHCPMRREGSNNAKTTEDKSTRRGTGEAASRSASFAQACEDILAQRDLRAVEQALAIRHQATEAVKKEADLVYDVANVYCDDHSTH